MSVITNTSMTDKQLKDAIKNAKIAHIIRKMNDMWHKGGFFDICTVRDLAEDNFRFIHEQPEYKVLSPYHCDHWRYMDSDTRTHLALVSLRLFNIPEIGYDTNSQKFIDIRFDAQFHKKKKEMAKLVHDTEDAEIIEVEDLSSEPKLNWFKSLIKRLLKL